MPDKIMLYKTWKCRLMSGYQQRKVGVKMLYRAIGHLGGPTSKGGPNSAYALIMQCVSKDGNFYKNHNNFPRWRQDLDCRIDSVIWYFQKIWLAITNSESIGFIDS